MRPGVVAVSAVLVLTFASSAPADYYAGINASSTGTPLKQQLQTLVANHTVLTYDAVWAALAQVEPYLDAHCNGTNGTIPDVYSANCWLPMKAPQGQECGNYKKEGDCFNREHGWPKSWWGGFSEGHNCETDLHELWASDGYVNGLRANLPLGAVAAPTYTSTNGCKIGPCASPGYNNSDVNGTGVAERCFEVADHLKGDFARSYFYIATAYAGEFECCDMPGVNGSSIKPWMEAVLREWHKFDPVSDSERQRNDAVFAVQRNRLPFIDHPEWVDLISDF